MTCTIDPMGDARGERAASPQRVKPYDSRNVSVLGLFGSASAKPVPRRVRRIFVTWPVCPDVKETRPCRIGSWASLAVLAFMRSTDSKTGAG
jgi:hypothetical protein